MLDIKLRENKIPEEKPAPIQKIDEVAVSQKTEHADSSEKDHAKALEARRQRQKKTRKVVMALLGAAIFFALTTAYTSYQVYVLKKFAREDALLHPDVPQTPDQIMEAVSHHILLPSGTPQIASVQDAKKLSTSQVFFKDALNGDVVLVYDTMIVLYRPTKDILVAVGDISGVTK